MLQFKNHKCTLRAYFVFTRLISVFFFMHIENKVALMDICFKHRLIPLKVNDDMDAASSWKANQVAMEATNIVFLMFRQMLYVVTRLCT